MIIVLFDPIFDMIVYFITFFRLVQEKDNPVPVVHNAAVRIRISVGSTSKYSARPPHTPNKKRPFLDLYNVFFISMYHAPLGFFYFFKTVFNWLTALELDLLVRS